jgi:hypothetical protein
MPKYFLKIKKETKVFGFFWTILYIKFNFGCYLVLVLCFKNYNLYFVQLAFCLFRSDVKI